MHQEHVDRCFYCTRLCRVDFDLHFQMALPRQLFGSFGFGRRRKPLLLEAGALTNVCTLLHFGLDASSGRATQGMPCHWFSTGALVPCCRMHIVQPALHLERLVSLHMELRPWLAWGPGLISPSGCQLVGRRR